MDEKKPLILFDTDMDTDYDDAGALALLLEYVNKGKADLLGIVADSVAPGAAPGCEIIAGYYGVDCPIGALSSDFCAGEKRLEPYRNHSEKFNLYQELAKDLGKTDKDYPSEVEVYRRCLLDAPDGSVVVVCVGMLTALANALMSQGDEISPLSGVELFRKKVKYIVSMGFPDQVQNFNWNMDEVASEQFFRLCPVPVYANSGGTGIITGTTFQEVLPEDHPVRRTYELFTPPGKKLGRDSWDQLALLYALEPENPLFRIEQKGTLIYNPEEHRSFWVEGDREDWEILLIGGVEETERYLEDRMTGKF